MWRRKQEEAFTIMGGRRYGAVQYRVSCRQGQAESKERERFMSFLTSCMCVIKRLRIHRARRGVAGKGSVV